MTGTTLAEELVQALDVEGEATDFNDYTPLDLLIYKARSDAKTAASLLDVLRTSIADIIAMSKNPGSLVNLLIGLKIKDVQIADQLEYAITTDRFQETGKRLAALTLLRASDRVLPPRYIVLDDDIRAFAPLQWLDLSLPVLGDPLARQQAILSLVDSGALGPTAMQPRLHGIWTAGGSEPVGFLTIISERLSNDQRHQFVGLVKEAFGISLALKVPVTTDAKAQAKAVSVPRRLKDRATKVTKEDETQLRDHKGQVRRSAIVRPFREFDKAVAA